MFFSSIYTFYIHPCLQKQKERACSSVLHYADNEDGQIQDCTSPAFEGLVALGDDNKASWVARWLRIDSFVAGLYAVKVNGKLPPHIISELEDQNISYRPRDGSAED
ncbi:hypothetical protein CA7LBN_004490 [Candidozyma auris]|uniref:Transcription elongation factor SPT4 n=1 Tax=Candidozyma auris TaxID=498019 RepID=A0A8F3AJN7_CANAR|nr:hypothetical protein CA7LBN_004490 [[Candida] auris]